MADQKVSGVYATGGGRGYGILAYGSRAVSAETTCRHCKMQKDEHVEPDGNCLFDATTFESLPHYVMTQSAPKTSRAVGWVAKRLKELLR